jgi:hypothetical protein
MMKSAAASMKNLASAALESTKDDGNNQKPIKAGAKGKIMLSFMQVLNQIKLVYTIPFPAVFSSFLGSLGFANLDFLTMVGMGCVAPFNFYGKLLAMTLVPLVLSTGLGIKYKLSKSDEQRNKCVAWFLKLTYLVFPGVSTVVFQAFPCYTFDDGSSYLKADLSIDCNAPEYSGMVTYAVLMTIMYPIGVTGMYAALLWRQRKAICPIEGQWRSFLCIKDALPPRLGSTKEEEGILEQRNLDMEKNTRLSSIQFLFKEYEPCYWWYEIFECFRRLMLTGGSVVFMEGSATQVVGGMLMAFLSIHVYSTCQAFIVDADDVLALLAQWGILFTLFGGLLFKLNLSQTDGYDNDGSGLGLFLVFVNVMVLVFGISASIYSLHASGINSAAGSVKSAIMKKLSKSTSHPTSKNLAGAQQEDNAMAGQVTATTNPAFQRTPSLRPNLTSEPTSVV